MKNIFLTRRTIAHSGKVFYLHLFLSVTLYLMVTGCAQQTPSRDATFGYFLYKGNDSIYNTPIHREKQYFNPILSGFQPDPSICRKGNDYYLVNSSFAYYPGIPIYHSTDLVNWTSIGHVLNRPSQLRLDKTRLSGGIYAPDIK
jgi:xylan 1,4-beta-xylosidase